MKNLIIGIALIGSTHSFADTNTLVTCSGKQLLGIECQATVSISSVTREGAGDFICSDGTSDKFTFFAVTGVPAKDDFILEAHSRSYSEQNVDDYSSQLYVSDISKVPAKSFLRFTLDKQKNVSIRMNCTIIP